MQLIYLPCLRLQANRRQPHRSWGGEDHRGSWENGDARGYWRAHPIPDAWPRHGVCRWFLPGHPSLPGRGDNHDQWVPRLVPLTRRTQSFCCSDHSSADARAAERVIWSRRTQVHTNPDLLFVFRSRPCGARARGQSGGRFQAVERVGWQQVVLRLLPARGHHPVGQKHSGGDGHSGERSRYAANIRVSCTTKEYLHQSAVHFPLLRTLSGWWQMKIWTNLIFHLASNLLMEFGCLVEAFTVTKDHHLSPVSDKIVSGSWWSSDGWLKNKPSCQWPINSNNTHSLNIVIPLIWLLSHFGFFPPFGLFIPPLAAFYHNFSFFRCQLFPGLFGL